MILITPSHYLCVYMYVFSDLPDTDDINTQVLLLGITRFETTPSPPQPVKFPLAKVKQKSNGQENGVAGNSDHNTIDNEKRIEVPTSNTTSLRIASNPTTAIDQTNAIGVVYQSIENLNKTTTGCFPLERRKPKKLNGNCDQNREESSSATSLSSNRNAFVEHYRFTDQILNRTHCINRIFERFHSQKQPSNNHHHHQRQQQQQQQSDSGVKQLQNGIERKAFYRWLNSNRRQTKRTDQCFDDINHTDAIDQQRRQQQQTVRYETSVIRKSSTKSNSIRKVTKKSATRKQSSTARRFKSCLPYCIAVRNDSVAGNSLASSHRFCEYRRKRIGFTAAVAEPNCCAHHCNRRFDSIKFKRNDSSIDCNFTDSEQTANTNYNNNNCCLFDNNLNNMDRSVDSIGSCSLDVDAESTDFSGIKSFRTK